MPSPIRKSLAYLPVLFALTAGYGQSADLPTRSACQKADALWNEQILPSRYAALPPLTSPGVLDLFKLAGAAFSVKALSNEGDELEEGRRKLVHAFGAEARLRWAANPASAYSGIFQSGAECVIGRFSLASKPTADSSIPALALKIFIDGPQPSVNLQLMHSVDGQAGHNFFAQTFSNILPPANSFATRLLGDLFEHAAVLFGAKDPNPGRLTLEHLAGILPDGQHIAAPKTPYQLLFQPTVSAHALMQNSTASDDFRSELAKLPVGMPLYNIYTLAEGEPAEKAVLLGQLLLVSPVIASRYGDEKLYFQHNMARQ